MCVSDKRSGNGAASQASFLAMLGVVGLTSLNCGGGGPSGDSSPAAATQATPTPTATPTPVGATGPLTGRWSGTYAWNCGSGLTGSTPIVFDLMHYFGQDAHVTGTATYLGGVSTIQSGGTQALTHVFLVVNPSAFAVYNVFEGTLSGATITGTTANGDTPAFPGAKGCSAPSGASGTFSVTKQ
jgi:hypothetical protein